MEANTERRLQAPEWRLTKDRAAAVCPTYFWQPMNTAPTHTKMLLLTQGAVALIGKWDGKDDFYLGWAPLPKVRKE